MIPRSRWVRRLRWLALLLFLALAVLAWGLRNPALTLASLEVRDDHPLLVMTWRGGYDWLPTDHDRMMGWYRRISGAASQGCTLFTAQGSGSTGVFGRNFDWYDSPALVLRTDPPDGYASISIVDIAYLGFQRESLMDGRVPWSLRPRLLITPLMPFDGMNEHGLVVAMAAVPASPLVRDPAKPTVHALAAIRLLLDRCRTLPEALALLEGCNLVFQPGPHLHFLIADAMGASAVVEYPDGRMVVLRNEDPWHVATNFDLSRRSDSEVGRDRYDLVTERLTATHGRVTAQGAMELLSRVRLEGQAATQWSAVYDQRMRQLWVTTGGRYEKMHRFSIPGWDGGDGGGP